MIVIRQPKSTFKAKGKLENGTFTGNWHFSFDDYSDPENVRFGTLRVLNDDTLSPGAVWPLRQHVDNEIVAYCASGEFRHADEKGSGGVLKKGWVQHATTGKGLSHSEVNNSKDEPMRLVQMWFVPSVRGLEPTVEQKPVEKAERTNKLLSIVSNDHQGALRIASDAKVFSCFLEKGKSVSHALAKGRGAYIYVLEGSSVNVNGQAVPELGAAKVTDEKDASIEALADAEILLIDVLMI